MQVKEQTWTNRHKGKHRPPKVIAGSSLFVANTSIGGVIQTGVSGGGIGQTTGRERSPTHTDNWIKDLLSMAPPIRTRPSFPHSQSPPSGSFHKPLILIHQRADTLKTMHRKLTNLITWTTVLSNSMKL